MPVKSFIVHKRKGVDFTFHQYTFYFYFWDNKAMILREMYYFGNILTQTSFVSTWEILDWFYYISV